MDPEKPSEDGTQKKLSRRDALLKLGGVAAAVVGTGILASCDLFYSKYCNGSGQNYTAESTRYCDYFDYYDYANYYSDYYYYDDYYDYYYYYDDYYNYYYYYL